MAPPEVGLRLNLGVGLPGKGNDMFNRSAPRALVVPMVMYEDVARAIDWLKNAFGIREILRFADPSGRVTHAQLEVEGREVMVGWPGEHYRAPAKHGCKGEHLYVGSG